MCKAI